MKLNLFLICLISGLTPIFGAPELEKKNAANALDTSPATKGTGDALADAPSSPAPPLTFTFNENCLAIGAKECALVITAATHVRTASILQEVAGVLSSLAILLITTNRGKAALGCMGAIPCDIGEVGMALC
ncbi:hypothetical protein PAAG_03484 [Paracoccidioides lutzii Pb01]|uniref:Hydrophobin n=1 Tax=Paracoccidioides lutzii (strain ATCC MYA-826 / Pb01) TaxID=502779 RepID=C1GXB0_PARBA|nr:hypothetical protein PAAG_03484 [Paracoccidioides lutzii Pb01]EEH41198.2 hypothetical protein PAAG_03484 [Paracoccidioides lutzii Pb01]